MNKTELIAATALATGLTKRDSERVLNTALEIITATLANGEKVQLSGFGTFDVRYREARMGRNVRTKEVVEVSATNVPTFRPSSSLKETVAK